MLVPADGGDTAGVAALQTMLLPNNALKVVWSKTKQKIESELLQLKNKVEIKLYTFDNLPVAAQPSPRP